jgi:hypothetical protein
MLRFGRWQVVEFMCHGCYQETTAAYKMTLLKRTFGIKPKTCYVCKTKRKAGG